jgi:hypothetical protein
VSHAFLSDAAEKVFTNLTRSEQAAVTTARAALQIGPRQGDPWPEAGPQAEGFVIRLSEKQTSGRGISLVYRYHSDMDASLILWLIVGP